MDREHARQEIRRRISCAEFLVKSKGGLYVCPQCGSGNGPNGTGGLKVYTDTNTWTCFACKGKGEVKYSGDVIDLIQLKYKMDYNTALECLAQYAGINIDQYAPTAKNNRTERPQSDYTGAGNTETPPEAKTQQGGAEAPTEAADYTAYYQECRKRLADPAAAEYLRSRGISIETAAAYWIGYDPEADPAQSGHPCPRIILPSSRAHYCGRRIDGQAEFAKLNVKGSTPAIFNGKALYAQDAQEVFITEGAFDALSLLEAGFTAIALNSTANADALIKELEQRTTPATLILCLDKDAAGQKATDTIKAGLQRLNISYMTADICGQYKDPNEHLTHDREAFIAAAERAQRQAARPDNTVDYIDALMPAEVERFKEDKKTGFANLDEQAGGLYTGLYVLAAISSLGKTSFALQLADQLAEAGNDVIFFSLEQSRLELVSKSIARRTVIKDWADTLNFDNAVTSLAIRKGYRPRQVQEAAEAYKKAVAGRLSIIEGNFNCDISFMGDYIRQYIKRTGTRPVVFIDYLQILQPTEDAKRQSTKETIDNSVTELKRISRELDLTVIIVSSVNRANYLTPIDFESLKESGGIEFTCDVVWGLQLQCLNDPLFDKDKHIKEKRQMVKDAKAANPRKIELCCLKNRYGIANYSCYYDYYPANDLFIEDYKQAQADRWKNAPTI